MLRQLPPITLHAGSRRLLALTLPGLLVGVFLALGMVVSAPVAFGQAGAAGIGRLDPTGSGSVSGVVVRGEGNTVTVADVQVTLQAVVGSIAKDVATTTTNSQGRFFFSGLDTSGLTTYAVYTHYQGGEFETPAITFTSGSNQQVTLNIYNTSSSDAGIKVDSTTLLFSSPDQATGLLSVAVLMTLENDSQSAYLASVAPANGLPTDLLRFYLPAGAQDLTLGAGFSGLTVIQVNTGFGVDATVPPGQSAYAFAYKIPYTGTQYGFQFKAEYPSDNVVALLPTRVGAIAGNFTVKPDLAANGSKYQVLAAANVASGTQLSFGLRNLPLPGENPDLDFGQLLLVGIGLLVLLLALALLFLRRGALAVAFGWVPASLLSPVRLKSRRQSVREAERKRLLRALLALDEKRAAGLIGPAAYSRQWAQLRSELRPLLLPKGKGTPDTTETAGRGAEMDGEQLDQPVKTGSRT
ncbi:MAG: hypothetical protein ACLQUY_03930 [Ktedonobacterales bacterium]